MTYYDGELLEEYIKIPRKCIYCREYKVAYTHDFHVIKCMLCEKRGQGQISSLSNVIARKRKRLEERSEEEKRHDE